MCIYTSVRADPDGLVLVLFLQHIMQHHFFQEVKASEYKTFLSLTVCVSGFQPARSDAALHQSASLNTATFTFALCLISFPVQCHICLAKSSLTYARSTERCPGEKGHKQEIGFLLLCGRAGIWPLPVSPSLGSLHHLLARSATT